MWASFETARTNMPPRNLNIIIVAAFVSVLCYFAHQRTRTAMMVGNALDLIDAYYVDPVDKEQLLISAMDGMTSTLDQHSEFIPQQDYGFLEEKGVSLIFGPGTPIPEAARAVLDAVNARQA